MHQDCPFSFIITFALGNLSGIFFIFSILVFKESSKPVKLNGSGNSTGLRFDFKKKINKGEKGDMEWEAQIYSRCN